MPERRQKIAVIVSDKEKARIERAAARAGLTVSSWARFTLLASLGTRGDEREVEVSR